MSKRLVLCCDGTWNTPDEEKDGSPAPTNVTKLALAVAPTDPGGVEQRTFYHRGVGTNRRDRITGGAFGVGLSRGVLDAYRFLINNYEPGDELFFFGFSRGAFTARSTAGLVRNCGILRAENADRLGEAYALYRSRRPTYQPRSVESQLFRKTFSYEPRIHFIGVWDTVGALGIPISGSRLINLINRRWQFHDTMLSSTVDAAYQALAIDEKRGPFQPTIWQTSNTPGQKVKQVWFPGVHSDVGGGYPQRGLSDISLDWMITQAKASGLALTAGAPTVDPHPLADAHISRKGMYLLVRPFNRQLGTTDPTHEYAASSVIERLANLPSYQPANLLAYRKSSQAQTEQTLPGGGT